jgi:transcriptional regulator with XRE-family HTH domain
MLSMIIGDRLRLLREEKNLSQGDIEERTGLLRSYLSRVENGHTIPSVETLEKIARAMDMELYQVLYDGPEPPSLPKPGVGKASRDGWGSSGKDARLLAKLRRCLSKMTPRDRRILMATVSQASKQRTQRI